VVKTTVYLPEELKRALEAEAAERRVSEADLIREAVRQVVGEPVRELPPGGVFRGGADVARNADKFLEGFGQW
jgi:predicted transcriptional regulator